MLRWRLLISAILIPLLGSLFYLDHQSGIRAPYLFGFALLLAIHGSYEIARLMKIRNFIPRFRMVCACNVAIVAATWWMPMQLSLYPPEGFSPNAPIGIQSLGPPMLAYCLSVMVLLFSAAIRFREPGKSMETLSAEILCITYVGLLLSMTAQLRWVAGADVGYLILGSLIVTTKGGDVGAYTIGRLFGNKKFSPHLSPKKTWSGVRGAVLFSATLATLWLCLLSGWFREGCPPCPIFWGILYGIIIGITGIIGDLCESLIKRDVGKKDSAQLFPGFGGLLDILDSVLYTAPIAYLLWKVFPISAWSYFG